MPPDGVAKLTFDISDAEEKIGRLKEQIIQLQELADTFRETIAEAGVQVLPIRPLDRLVLRPRLRLGIQGMRHLRMQAALLGDRLGIPVVVIDSGIEVLGEDLR